MQKEVIKVINIKKYYGKDENLVKAVDDISLSVNKGEFVTILGASGSGKTTLMNCICGISHVDDGSIIISDTEISKLYDEKRSIFRRRHIGVVFQQYNLLPILNVCENITLPLEIDNREIDKDYYTSIIKALGIEEKQYSPINKLSGGQMQRVAIARALITKPDIICADEPTGNLDSGNAKEVIMLFKRAVEEFGATVIMITHNEEIAKLSDRVIYIKDGKIDKEINNHVQEQQYTV